MSKTKVKKVKKKIDLSRHQLKFKHLLKVNHHFLYPRMYQVPKELTLNYSGAAVKKRQAAIKDALVKLFEASTQTVETEMQYSELDEIFKHEGKKFLIQKYYSVCEENILGAQRPLKVWEGSLQVQQETSSRKRKKKMKKYLTIK